MVVMTLSVMDQKKGHKELKYNTENPDQVKSVTQEILDKIRMGWILYGAKVGNELEVVADFSIMDKAPDKKEFVEQKLKELDRFIMNKDIKRKVLAAPLVSG